MQPLTRPSLRMKLPKTVYGLEFSTTKKLTGSGGRRFCVPSRMGWRAHVCNAVMKLQLDRPSHLPCRDARQRSVTRKVRGPKQELVCVSAQKVSQFDKISFCDGVSGNLVNVSYQPEFPTKLYISFLGQNAASYS